MKLALIGLVAGFMSALLGVGGGLMVVPLLLLLLAFTPHVATATSLAAIGITALAGTITFAIAGEVDPAHALLVGLPAAAGATLGATLQQRVRARELCTSSRRSCSRSPCGCSYDVRARRPARVCRRDRRRHVRRRRRDPLRADADRARPRSSGGSGDSLAAILPTVAAGTWRQASYGNVRWRRALVIGLTSVVGVLGGAQAALALPEDVLRRLFASS